MTSGIDEAAAELQGSLFGEVSPAIDTPGAALARSYPVRITVVACFIRGAQSRAFPLT
jgi:hypothetical protein